MILDGSISDVECGIADLREGGISPSFDKSSCRVQRGVENRPEVTYATEVVEKACKILIEHSHSNLNWIFSTEITCRLKSSY